MKVCGHDTEISKAKTEFVFCVLQGNEHYFSSKTVLEYTDFVVSPAGNMIKSSISEFTFFSHWLSLSRYILLLRGAVFCFDFWGRFLFFSKKPYAGYGVGFSIDTMEIW